MPYNMNNPPKQIEGLPKHAKEIWIAAFNSAYGQYKEDGKVSATAWAAVKKKYEQDREGKWVAKDKNFAEGESGWFPVFRTGTHTSSSGISRTWTEADLESIANKYNPQQHEAPLVVGHPKTNHPAYGWVEGLKRSGQFLFARAKNIVPEFKDMVNRGMFKKRSISLYPDNTLKHIGFLGAAPPAVKGLPDVQFDGSEEAVTFEFSENWKMRSIADVFRRLREWIIDRFDSDTADRIVPNWTIEDLAAEPNEPEPNEPEFQAPLALDRHRHATEFNHQTSIQEEREMGLKDTIKKAFTKAIDELPEDQLGSGGVQSFCESEVRLREETAARKAKEETRKQVEAEFTEKERVRAREARKGEIKSWYEQKLKEGKIAPAWAKMGLNEFMLNLDAETEIEFSESGKKSGLDWFKGFIEELPKVVEFREIAGRDTDMGAQGDEEKRDKLVSEYMEQHKEATEKDAILAVSDKHPELFGISRQK